MTKCKTLGVFAIIMLGMSSLAYAGTIRHDVDPSAYLDLGASADFAGVGRVDIGTASGNYIGSGTLIAQDWVLTAAHVVEDATSISFSVGGQILEGSNWTAHPKWTGDLLNGYDIGLIQLSSTVDSAISPMSRYTGTDELGATITSVGYGKTGTGLTGATTFDGQKRAGQNVLDAYYGKNPRKAEILLCDFDNPLTVADNAYGSASPLELEYLVAPGDSGGGAFIDIGGELRLAGVTSFLAALDGNLDADYGDLGGFTRVSKFNDWIDEVMGGGSDTPDNPGKGRDKPDKPGKPASVGTVFDSYLSQDQVYTMPTALPEPATLSLLVIGGLGLLRRSK